MFVYTQTNEEDDQQHNFTRFIWNNTYTIYIYTPIPTHVPIVYRIYIAPYKGKYSLVLIITVNRESSRIIP